MKNTTKGAIAGGAAGVLLLGGLGSLAYWSDSETLDGGSVTAGTLSLGTPVCAPGVWQYAPGSPAAGDPVNLIVPGDEIVKDCTFTITATGDNLEADLTTPATTSVTGGEGTTLKANVSAAYVSSGAPINAKITDANDGDVVTATIMVAFPRGDAATINTNDMQGITAQLNAIPVTLTQSGS